MADAGEDDHHHDPNQHKEGLQEAFQKNHKHARKSSFSNSLLKTFKTSEKKESKRSSLRFSYDSTGTAIMIPNYKTTLDNFMMANAPKRRPGTTWSYYDIGKEEGRKKPVLVYLHGGALRPEASFEQLNGLSVYFRVVAPTIPSDFNNFDDYVEGIFLVLDYEKIERAHFYGTAFGGMVAHYLLYKYPHRVLSLVLSESCPPNEELGKLFRKYGRKEKLDHAPPTVLRYFMGFMTKSKELESGTENVDDVTFWSSVLKNFGVTSKEAVLPKFEAAASYHLNNSFRPHDFSDWNRPLLIIDREHVEDGDINAAAEYSKLHTHPAVQVQLLKNTGRLMNLHKGRLLMDVLLKFYVESKILKNVLLSSSENFPPKEEHTGVTSSTSQQIIPGPASPLIYAGGSPERTPSTTAPTQPASSTGEKSPRVARREKEKSKEDNEKEGARKIDV